MVNQRSFFTSILFLFITAILIASAAAETAPEIPKGKFKQCHTSNPEFKTKVLKKLSRDLNADQEPISCKPGKGVFNSEGKFTSKPVFSKKQKNCILVRKFCFMDTVYSEKFLMPNEGDLLVQLYAKIYPTARVLRQGAGVTVLGAKEKESSAEDMQKLVSLLKKVSDGNMDEKMQSEAREFLEIIAMKKNGKLQVMLEDAMKVALNEFKSKSDASEQKKMEKRGLRSLWGQVAQSHQKRSLNAGKMRELLIKRNAANERKLDKEIGELVGYLNSEKRALRLGH